MQVKHVGNDTAPATWSGPDAGPCQCGHGFRDHAIALADQSRGSCTTGCGCHRYAAAGLSRDELLDALRTVREAIAIPCPATVGGREKYAEILTIRVMHAKSTLDGLLAADRPYAGAARDVAYLRERLAEHPAEGYKTWDEHVAELEAARKADRPDMRAAALAQRMTRKSGDARRTETSSPGTPQSRRCSPPRGRSGACVVDARRGRRRVAGRRVRRLLRAAHDAGTRSGPPHDCEPPAPETVIPDAVPSPVPVDAESAAMLALRATLAAATHCLAVNSKHAWG
jgi:hypothetical protein